MYSAPLPGDSKFAQGDILNNFPLINTAAVVPVVIEGSKVTIQEDISFDANTTAVVAEVEPRKVMIISQTCDAQRRENIIICPLYGLEDYIQTNQPNADQLRSLRKGQIYYWFYLQASDGVLEESFVDLQQFTYVRREIFESLATQKILQLNSLGKHRLAWTVSNFFGRPL